VVSRVHAAVVATDELERLLGATDDAIEDATDEGATLLAGTLEGATDERLEDDGATELGALELVGVTVPQPIGWVDTTMSSIHTSAERPLKLWKPNIT
jgi:hypothetical protein